MPAPTDPAADLDALLSWFDRAVGWLDTRGATLAAPRPAVSSWSPLQHLDHVALATATITVAVSRILAADLRCVPAGATSDAARAILESGSIPRGVADAPDVAKPAPGVDLATVRAHLVDCRARLAALAPRAASIARADLRAPHFALGPLTGAEWLRFARIHADHHRAIAREAAAV